MMKQKRSLQINLCF